MNAPSELRITIAIVLLLTLPGWAFLAATGLWQRWAALQRWCVAVGLSLAFFPAILYFTRFVAPGFRIGEHKVEALLLLCAIIVVWQMRSHLREVFGFDLLEWAAIAVFAATLFTRYWIIRDHPTPAWSDSLHHAILTQLTAEQGRLPIDMQPYFPIPLGQYHLGLYALTAPVVWLSSVPAHTALLWMAQALNGLCGLGVYLVLDRKAGRLGAVIGASAVGLWSHMPAWYVNWGRFTQVSSQAVLLIAWVVTWEALAAWKHWQEEQRRHLLWISLAAALLTGSVFLLHFRVAAFYLPLLGLTVLLEWARGFGEGVGRRILAGILVIGGLSILVVAPAAVEAIPLYLGSSVRASPELAAETAVATRAYYEFPLSVFPSLIARPWLLVLASVAAMLGLVRRDSTAFLMVMWMLAVIAIGNTYRLGIPALNVTNLGAVLIMLYLPIGVLIGAALEQAGKLYGYRRGWVTSGALAVALILGIVTGSARATEVEDYRYFVTDADLAGMAWIRANTPLDATIALNTYFWLPTYPHGTDGGYWIPYFTGRQTSASSMLFPLADQAYKDTVVEMSRAAAQLAEDDIAIAELRTLGVDYIYIGPVGSFAGKGLDPLRLSKTPGITTVYQKDNVSIYRLDGPP